MYKLESKSFVFWELTADCTDDVKDCQRIATSDAHHLCNVQSLKEAASKRHPGAALISVVQQQVVVLCIDSSKAQC